MLNDYVYNKLCLLCKRYMILQVLNYRIKPYEFESKIVVLWF